MRIKSSQMLHIGKQQHNSLLTRRRGIRHARPYLVIAYPAHNANKVCTKIHLTLSSLASIDLNHANDAIMLLPDACKTKYTVRSSPFLSWWTPLLLYH